MNKGREVKNNSEEVPVKIKCKRCSYMGHQESECRTKICTYCNYLGHLEDTCRKNPEVRAKNIVCFNCKEQGHKITDCKMPKRPKFIKREQKPSFCSFCRVEGHYLRDCHEVQNHVCSACGEKGHWQRYCTSDYIKRN